MPTVRAFPGIRYSSPDRLNKLVCPPYDVISPQEQRDLQARDPHNAVRLELATNSGDAGPAQYKNVAEIVASWLSDEVLQRETTEALYVYRQDFVAPTTGARSSVVGAIGALELEEFGDGVLPHERTMEGPKADRLALMRATQMNISPVYAIYRGGGDLAPFYSSLEDRPPLARFSDESDILHRLWVITAPAEIDMLSQALRGGPLVIADGHHRYETALAYHREQAGGGDHDAIMCFCVDADSEDLVVLPYNRVLRTHGEDPLAALAGFEPQEVQGSSSGSLSSSKSDHPFLLVLPDGDALLEISDAQVVSFLGDRAPAWRGLDVVALHDVVLKQAFPEGLEEVGFTRDPGEVRRLVGSQGWHLGILLRPLDAPQVVEVARSGERMPQKASYFWPKALTGLVFRSL